MLSEIERVAPDAVSLLATYAVHSTAMLVCVGLLVRLLSSSRTKERVLRWAVVAPVVTAVAQCAYLSGTEITWPAGDSGVPVVAEAPVRPPENSPMVATLAEAETQSSVLPASVDTSQVPVSPPAVSPMPPTLELVDVSAVEAEGAVESEPGPGLMVILFMAYAAVTLLLLARTGLLALRASLWMRRATREDAGRLSGAVSRFARTHAVSETVGVRVADVNGPCAFGPFRWRIVFPADCADRLSSSELRALIAHEFAHLVRRDTVWLWVFRVLGDVAWFQPLNRIAFRTLRSLSEICSDDWAMDHGVKPLELARCLTQVSEWSTAPVFPVQAPATGFRSTLSARVERLVEAAGSSRPPVRRPGLLSGCVLIGFTAALISILPRASFAAETGPGWAESNPPAVDRAAAGDASTSRTAEDLHTQLRAVTDDLIRVRALLQNDPDPRVRSLARALEARVEAITQTLSRSNSDRQPKE